MDLSALITRNVSVSDRDLWLLVMARGACATSGLARAQGYPVSVRAPAARAEAAAALAVCARCPVRAECLELSLRSWAVGQFGVWGGTVPAEREELRAGRTAQLARVMARNRAVERIASSAL